MVQKKGGEIYIYISAMTFPHRTGEWSLRKIGLTYPYFAFALEESPLPKE